MATLPGITQTATGYTFEWVYTGGNYSVDVFGNPQSAGDFGGVGPTELFTNDLALNSGPTTVVDGQVIDNKLLGSSGTGAVFRPSSTPGFQSGSLTVKDSDGVVDSTKDPEGQITTDKFRLTHGGVSDSYVRDLPAGANIVVRGTIEFSLLNDNNVAVPGVTVTGYVLAVARADGTFDNFGMAMDQNVNALLTQYGIGTPKLKVLATTAPAPVPICFTADSLIDTDRGPVRAADLKVGDMVRTRDAGVQPIRWIDQNRMRFLPFDGNAIRPVRIRAGALGPDTPSTDLLVSPQHRILVRSAIAQKMFGTSEVLVAAKQLLQIDGIDVAQDLDDVTYVHFLFDDHQIVFSNGTETESLYTGPEALNSVGPAARDEIFALFPELADRDDAPAAARPLVSGRMGRRLAVRHAQHRKPLVM